MKYIQVLKVILWVGIFWNSYAFAQLSAQPNNISVEQDIEVSSATLNSEDLIQAIQLYNSKQYESSLSVLQKVKNNPELIHSYNYLSGLNYYKLQNYDVAERYLNEVVKYYNIKKLANAYYYIGLCQYHKEEYENAINSFELSLDTSSDSLLDKKSEIMIEKCLQIQNKLEKDKIKWTLGFGLGYQSDSNVLNTKETDKSLNGHVINWNGFVAYKAFSDKDSLFEPMLYYSDMMTMDNSFKDDTDLKKSDATQILLSTPFKTKYNAFTSKSSLNFGYYLLPNDSNQKSLAISLIFFRQDILVPIKNDLDGNMKIIIGRDQSQLSYSDAEDNQNSIKFELSGGIVYQIPKLHNNTLSTDLGYIINNAQGDNAKYNKYYINLDYSMPGLFETESSFKIDFSSANYFKSSTGRKEEATTLGYSLSKDINEQASLSGFISQNYNYSTIDTNKYNDTVIGVQLLYISKF